MPHKSEQFLADGVSVPKRMEGVCEEIKVIIFMLDGLCLPAFWFWEMKVNCVDVQSWGSTMCCNNIAGCDSGWSRCCGDMGVVDIVVGLPLCWVGC